MKLFLSFFIFFILQITLFPFLSISGVVFNGILILILLLGFFRIRWVVLILPALIIGIVLDVVSAMPFGLFAMTYGITTFLLVITALYIPYEHSLHFMIYLFVGTFFFNGVLWMLLYIYRIVPTYMTLHYMIMSIVYNIIGGIVCYGLLCKKIRKITH